MCLHNDMCISSLTCNLFIYYKKCIYAIFDIFTNLCIRRREDELKVADSFPG